MGEETPTGFYVTIATPKGATVKRVDGDLLSVGRAEDCNLRIVHAELGRRHLSLMLQNGRCCVEDHGSTNGTYVNGKRIPPHTPTPVAPTDQVQLGHSSIRLSVATEIERPVHKTGDETESPETQPPIVTSTQGQRKKARQNQPAPSENDNTNPSIFDAQKKAALVLQNAEIETEQKVQELYRRADEALEKADQAYQRKLNEAYRDAEKVYQKTQVDVASILDSAREKAADIRAQAETYVADLRHRTDEDCERTLEEAQLTARELKANRLMEADDLIRAKEEALLKDTREAMTQRLSLFESDLQRESDRQRIQVESEIRDRQAQANAQIFELEAKAEKLKLEARQLVEVSDRERKTLEELEQSLERDGSKFSKLNRDSEEAKQNLATAKEKLGEVREEIQKLEASKFGLQNQINEAQSKLMGAVEEEKHSNRRVREAQDSLSSDLLKLKENHEKKKADLVKLEKEQEEQFKLDAARTLHRNEEQMLEELGEKKTRMSREIALALETFIKQNPNPQGRAFSALHAEITRQIDGQISTLSKEPGGKAKRLRVITLKNSERWRARMLGGFLGAAFLFCGQFAYTYFKNESSPLQRRVAAAVEERKIEMERRKFAPAQTPELRDTYVDSVIYTEGFSAIYVQDDFQKKFLGKLAPFMLKTWRLDEEKSIHVLAAAASLVKELAEKRENIHPDFVAKDIDKMHALEVQSVEQMKQALGSEVRYESFRKQEREFFMEYRARAAGAIVK